MEVQSLTITTNYPPKPASPNPQDIRDTIRSNKTNENLWIQRKDVDTTLRSALEHLKACCIVLNLSAKCDERLNVAVSHGTTEKYQLMSRTGSSDNLKAAVTLLDDNVIQAEVTVKYPKAGGGYYRAVAQPDVQWKLQQLQDLGNHISRVTITLCDLQHEVNLLKGDGERDAFTLATGARILEELKLTMNEISLARNSIMLPRKRSLLELCYFPPTRKFVPPLPQDQLISFYISCCRLVCASYQMVPKTVHPQGLSVFMAESQLPHLDDVIKHLNTVMAILQKLINYLSATMS
ncbi:Protein rogdi homolog [Caenorhabditis elegans]|uniref:Protein rogdi homolog n=1 Tax=Caenorhabditis elegans TaxID=6239 RepID=ROGDI_CAEEL|nr:Protein rogdi homolog [Caenorhabditis elegans]O17213.2 RecName: Full=Protein rogdi homolog [Caenorhabditis elegans]CCD72343.1 Protein rogdi homolog [Caenorhabditis elegans]|eukprot:NP_498641.1 Protein rogdi homolog [Caenorhabditis elegans]